MMQELLREAWLSTGTTLLFVTHDVEEALFLADRILIMSAKPGKIVEEIVLPFGRERDIEALAGHPQYGEIKHHVLHRVRQEAKRHLG
jgi:NitT/TauT family transport system ATP-binding protein